LLREVGAAALSLALLDHAEAGGLSSGWTQDSRARALMLLQRPDEAKAIWRNLRRQSDKRLSDVAGQQLIQLEVEDRIPEIWSLLQCIAEKHSWTYGRLSSELSNYSLFERALLEEIILARETGASSLSLELIHFALKAGFRSPWFHDNRARALLNHGEVLAACRIWRELEACSALADLRAAAAEMLHRCHRQEQRALAAQREREWVDSAHQLHQKGNVMEAEMELLKGWILYPESEPIEKSLIELLEQRRCKEDPQWSELSPALQRGELSLEAQEAFLGAVERWLEP